MKFTCQNCQQKLDYEDDIDTDITINCPVCEHPNLLEAQHHFNLKPSASNTVSKLKEDDINKIGIFFLIGIATFIFVCFLIDGNSKRVPKNDLAPTRRDESHEFIQQNKAAGPSGIPLNKRVKTNDMDYLQNIIIMNDYDGHRKVISSIQNNGDKMITKIKYKLLVKDDQSNWTAGREMCFCLSNAINPGKTYTKSLGYRGDKPAVDVKIEIIELGTDTPLNP